MGAVNKTEEVAEEEEPPAFPPWYGELSKKMEFMADAAPRIGSVQMVMECIVDREYTGMDKDAVFWKLTGPAIYWLCYPLLMVGWVILVAFIEIRGLYPMVMAIVKATKKKDPAEEAELKALKEKQEA